MMSLMSRSRTGTIFGYRIKDIFVRMSSDYIKYYLFVGELKNVPLPRLLGKVLLDSRVHVTGTCRTGCEKRGGPPSESSCSALHKTNGGHVI